MTTVTTPPILLSPRPLARCPSSFPLLPLLPHRPPVKPLPSEVWSKILDDVFHHYESDASRTSHDREEMRRGLLVICKDLKAVALPLYYARVHIASLPTLAKFTAHLHDSDQKWDSIRRIPYSTPGRWVQCLDLSDLQCCVKVEAFRIDALLTQLFPLVPLMTRLILNTPIILSRRAMTSLACRDGISNVRALMGVQLSSSNQQDDIFVEMLRLCPNLEELEVLGSGIDASEPQFSGDDIPLAHLHALQLPRLRKLVMLSMPSSSMMFTLLHSPLPSLRHLTITPYDDVSVPTSLFSQFIDVHGEKLTSLHLYTVKQWPTALFPSPTTLLQTCPKLCHLSLELPLPVLSLSSDCPRHSLQILSIPRPDAEFLNTLEALLPKLLSLQFVRARDVRWLRSGMSSRAQQAGVQGEMVVWRKRLARRGIQLVDSEWSLNAG